MRLCLFLPLLHIFISISFLPTLQDTQIYFAAFTHAAWMWIPLELEAGRMGCWELGSWCWVRHMPRLAPANLSSSRWPHSSATTNFLVVIFPRLRGGPSPICSPTFLFYVEQERMCCFGCFCAERTELPKKKIYLSASIF